MNIKNIAIYIMYASIISLSLSGCKQDDDSNENISDNNVNNWENTESYKIRMSTYANMKNISPEEAKRRLAMMDIAYEWMPMLDDYFRDSISGIYYDDEGGEFGLTVRTTRMGERSILDEHFIKDMKEKTGMLIKIRNNSVKNSKEIPELVSRQMAIMSKTIPGLDAISYNPKSDSIVIEVYDENFKSSEELSEYYNITHVEGMKVEFHHLLGRTEPAILAGGGKLTGYLSAGKTTGCTAGFSGFAADKVTPAIITAYHCLNRTDSNPNGVNSFSYTDNNKIITNLSIANTIPSANHDMALLLAAKGTKLTGGAYLGDVGEPFPIIEFGNKRSLVPNSGQYLCHYGRSSGYSCGEVTSLYRSQFSTQDGLKVCNTNQEICNSTFITIESIFLACKPGDSGGPVVAGNGIGYVAYGIASSCNLKEIDLGKTPRLALSSLEYINELPAYLATTSVK